jgi:hypothetical protein
MPTESSRETFTPKTPRRREVENKYPEKSSRLEVGSCFAERVARSEKADSSLRSE